MAPRYTTKSTIQKASIVLLYAYSCIHFLQNALLNPTDGVPTDSFHASRTDLVPRPRGLGRWVCVSKLSPSFSQFFWFENEMRVSKRRFYKIFKLRRAEEPTSCSSCLRGEEDQRLGFGISPVGLAGPKRWSEAVGPERPSIGGHCDWTKRI